MVDGDTRHLGAGFTGRGRKAQAQSGGSKQMSPKDRIAAIIATGLVSWGLVLMIGLVWNKQPLSESGGEIFLAIATGLVAALGMYFATKNGNGKE